MDISAIVSALITFAWAIVPYIITVLIAVLAWKVWLYYIRYLYVSKIEWVLLQIKIPKDVFKSPLAMEVALASAFNQAGGVGTWYQRYWQGRVLMWFSLEIVSISGKVYFFVRVPVKPSNYRSFVESQIYAQYPQAEITEVPDYTNDVPHNDTTGEWSMWGMEFVFSQKDPYPIKTYVDYGLDRSVGLDEEQKVDPITPMIEFFGSLGEGEQMWFQILVRASPKRFKKKGTWFKKIDWRAVAQEEINDIMKRDPKTLLHTTFADKEAKFAKAPALTKGEQEKVAAIERSLAKPGFDVGIRSIYIAKKDKFNAINITGLGSVVKQYNSHFMNGFKGKNATDFSYPWQDFKGVRTMKLKKEMFDAYRLRSYFYAPHKWRYTAGKLIEREPIVLTSEELATIYHFPGKVSETPSFKRIESKKAEPPINLPI